MHEFTWWYILQVYTKYHGNLQFQISSILFIPFKFVLMFTGKFKFFQCCVRTASLLKTELQAYEIIVASTFFWAASEMHRLPACFDNPAKLKISASSNSYFIQNRFILHQFQNRTAQGNLHLYNALCQWYESRQEDESKTTSQVIISLLMTLKNVVWRVSLRRYPLATRIKSFSETT